MQVGQRIALNAALMIAKQVVMAVLGVAFVGYMAREVGVSAWGEFQASLALTAMVTVVAGIGVRGYLAREVAVQPELGARHLGAALMIRGVSGAVLLGLTVVVALTTKPGLGATLVAIAAASQLATLLYSTMWLTFEAHERMQYIAYAELGARLFVIGVASAMLALGYGIVAAAAVFMVGNVVELGITYYFVRARFYRPHFGATFAELVQVTKRSVPIGILAALLTALSQADRVVLRVLCDENAVGVYSAAWVLSENFRMIPDIFLGASFAAGMRLYSDREAFGGLYRGCMTAAAVLGLPIAAGVAVVAPGIVNLIYGHDSGYAPAALVLQILVCQVPLSFAFQVAALPLLASRREVDLVKLLLAGLAVNVVLDLVLVPRYRAVGAATATLVTTAFTLAVSLAITRQWVRLVHPGRLAANVAATALMTLGAYGAQKVAGMWVAMAVGAPLYVALLLGLRAVTPEELRALLRRRAPNVATAPAASPAPAPAAAPAPVVVVEPSPPSVGKRSTATAM